MEIEIENGIRPKLSLLFIIHIYTYLYITKYIYIPLNIYTYIYLYKLPPVVVDKH